MHWEALTNALRQDGLVAIMRLGQVRNAASAKLLSITCKQLLAISFFDLSANWIDHDA